MASNNTISNSVPSLGANPTQTQTENQSSQTQTGNQPFGSFALGPDDIIYTLHHICEEPWPVNLKLSLNTPNWKEWSFQAFLFTDKHSFTEYLEGFLLRSDKTSYPKAHHLWGINDRSFKAFLITHILHNDCHLVGSCTICHDAFETLQKTHQKCGLHAKMLLFNKAMSICYQPDVPLATTYKKIESLFIRIVNMGPFNDEQLRQSLHLHALADNYQHIHQYLMNLADDSSFSFTTIICRIH
jgi:gag-polypeptide of LTR copia-type